MSTTRRLRAARGLLAAYAATSAAHLGAIVTGASVLQNATKPALMPLLAAQGLASSERAPRLLAPALLASAAGDVLLQLDGQAPFLAGMGAFAAAHVAYVTMFVRMGALTDRRRSLLVGAAYAAVWAAMIVGLWPGLGALRVPVAAYSLLLASTAVTSAGIGLRAGVGGGLFLLSDGLIATGLAGWPQLPGHGFWIMASYVVAQYLLSSGTIRAAEDAAGAEPAASAVEPAGRLGAPA